MLDSLSSCPHLCYFAALGSLISLNEGPQPIGFESFLIPVRFTFVFAFLAVMMGQGRTIQSRVMCTREALTGRYNMYIDFY